jgi:signal transduction histidine kinase
VSAGSRSALRVLLAAAGMAVAVESLLAFRLADWPVYAVYVLIVSAVYLPAVEVQPRITIGIAQQGVTIGFLYIGGLPVILLSYVPPAFVHLLRRGLRAAGWTPWGKLGATLERRDWFSAAGRLRTEPLAEMGVYSVGLVVRWWIVSSLAPNAPPTASPFAMAAAELGGYVVWGLLAVLPIFPDRTLMPRPILPPVEKRASRSMYDDMRLVFVQALTPFVFLIAYGFEAHGLVGAAFWSFSTLGVHFMLKTLTERRLEVEEQNRRLAALNHELEHRERLSAIGKMSSVVSHQTLQHLGVIGIHADLIRNLPDDADPRESLVRARQSARSIEVALGDVNRVLTDLLVFSRDLRLNLYEHSIARIVGECVEECRSEAVAHGVSLRPQASPADLSVTVDKLKVKQALTNVLRNAIEASPAGGVVAIEVAARDGSVEIAVADQGQGLRESEREAIFAPFYTTKERGTGLGLAIAREFTVAHGGSLSVGPASAGAQGARFLFRLPLEPPT